LLLKNININIKERFKKMGDITKKIEVLEELYEKVSEHFRYIEEFIR